MGPAISIGIDPGLRGAVAILWRCGTAHVDDIPTHGGEYDLAGMVGLAEDMADIAKAAGSYRILLESPRTIRLERNGQALSPTVGLHLGRAVGIWQGLLAAVGLEVETIEARAWKSIVLGGRAGRGHAKPVSLAVARRIFPGLADKLSRSRHHDRAEALLIAHYGLNVRTIGRHATHPRRPAGRPGSTESRPPG